LQVACFPDKGLGARQGGGLHEKSRTGTYPFADVARSPVPDDKVAWGVPFSEYDPPDYCAPACTKEVSFWSDQNSSEGIIHNAGCTPADNVDRISHVATYTVDPATNLGFNPCGRTGIKGQGVLGRFGPNHAADPVVTRWKRDKDYTVVQDETGKPVLEWISIQRADTGAWAIPGGFVDPGEGISLTLKREFGEEALNTLHMSTAEKEEALAGIQELWGQGVMMYQGYMDDSRNTDNAWIETICYNFHDKLRLSDWLPLKAGDDAKSVRWCAYVAGNPDGLKLHAGHVMLMEQTYQHVLASSPPDSETLSDVFEHQNTVLSARAARAAARSTSKLQDKPSVITASQWDAYGYSINEMWSKGPYG